MSPIIITRLLGESTPYSARVKDTWEWIGCTYRIFLLGQSTKLIVLTEIREICMGIYVNGNSIQGKMQTLPFFVAKKLRTEDRWNVTPDKKKKTRKKHMTTYARSWREVFIACTSKQEEKAQSWCHDHKRWTQTLWHFQISSVSAYFRTIGRFADDANKQSNSTYIGHGS